MQKTRTTPVIHSGNYYAVSTARVVAKLDAMGIEVPSAATELPAFQVGEKSIVEFTRIEHAMLDWFEGRDYDQAQALIHYQPVQNGAHVIRILHEATCPSEISQDMICPSLADAIAAVIYGCDRDTVVLDEVRRDNDAVIAVIHGIDTLRIEAIVCEPFNIAIRDRVRTAFKGVREYDLQTILDRVARLPGLANVADPELDHRHPRRIPDACLLFGFPGNWAFAMRSALQQVDIVVTQSQAQELVAVFFGAGSWHQLIKHRDQLNSTACPVAVSVTEPFNRQLFYQTPEEALFAVGTAAKALTEPLVISTIGLSLDKRRLCVAINTQRNYDETPPSERFLSKQAIETGMNDYWAASDYVEPAHFDAALELCDRLDALRNCTPATAVATAGILYKRDGVEALLRGLLAREGLASDNLIFIGQFAFAVFHVPDPDGLGMLTAQARIYRIDESGVEEVNQVAMYKAEIEVKEAVGVNKLVITPDYGNGEAIEIGFVDIEQVMRLLALTHGDDLFARSVPRLPIVAERYQH